MKFIAKRIDLEIEVETLSGETKIFKTAPMNAESASLLLDKMIADEKAFVTDVDDIDKGNAWQKASVFMDDFLSAVYNTEKGYWKANFDIGTMKEIKTFIFNELSAARKNA